MDQTALSMLGAWVRRSRSLPLDFQLVSTDHLKEKIEAITHQLRYEPTQFSGFSKKVKELKELQIQASERRSTPPYRYLSKLLKPVAHNLTRLALNDVPLEELTALPRRAFPNLERLVLGIASVREWDRFSWTDRGDVKAFAHKPSPLTHVALRRYYRSETQDHILLPFSQLTHFIDYGPAWGESTDFFCNILPTCSFKYLSLSLSIRDATSADSFRGKPLTPLPTIRSLNIDQTSAGYPTFLGHFTFPNVTRLTISTPDIPFPSRWIHPGRFPELQYLTLALFAPCLTAESVRVVLEALPQLTSLDITLTQDSLRVLCLHHFPSVVPNLAFLTLRDTSGAYPADEACHDWLQHFTHLVVSRRLPVGELKRVHIVSNWWRDEELMRLRTVGGKFEQAAVLFDLAGLTLEVTHDVLWKPADRFMDVLMMDDEIRDWQGVADLVTQHE